MPRRGVSPTVSQQPKTTENRIPGSQVLVQRSARKQHRCLQNCPRAVEPRSWIFHTKEPSDTSSQTQPSAQNGFSMVIRFAVLHGQTHSCYFTPKLSHLISRSPECCFNRSCSYVLLSGNWCFASVPGYVFRRLTWGLVYIQNFCTLTVQFLNQQNPLVGVRPAYKFLLLG